jgi:hypothetical protein
MASDASAMPNQMSPGWAEIVTGHPEKKLAQSFRQRL